MQEEKTMGKDAGVIFNIQKFSLNDGPGIRTVVFLKGCPLRCRWCANPESQLAKVQIMNDSQKCLHCGHCRDICPAGAIRFSETSVSADPFLCTGCGACISECPAKALKNEGEMKTVEEIVKVVMQDMPFYEESGGGVTLSGGEMLAQPAFAKELIRACKAEGISTCCETTGFAEPSVFMDVIEDIDYILFDVKHWSIDKHKEGTGVSNEKILINLKMAIDAGKDVLPRIPVIPAFNDSPEDAKGIAEALKKAGASKCQLLPFHQFGENKYEQLGMEYAYKNTAAYHREDLEDYLNVYKENGIDAFF